MKASRRSALALAGSIASLLAPARWAEAAPAPAPAPRLEFSSFGAALPSGSQKQILLVVPILNKKEVDANLALLRQPDGRDFVSLDDFTQLAGLGSQREADGSVRLSTPLGDALLTEADLLDDKGTTFVDVAALSRSLAAQVAFDQAEFALKVTLPWTPGEDTASQRRRPVESGPVDIAAPSASLSRWRSEVLTVETDGYVSSTANHRLVGALGPGNWRADFSHNLSGNDLGVDVGALSWRMDRGNSRLLLGQERVFLHPLLQSFDLTGAQYAWTNAPGQVFDSSLGEAGQLLAYQARPTSVIRGSGPPGGTAELRYGGSVFARQTIRLDGRYEFTDVPAAPGDAIPVEVAVYEFGDNGTPLRVDQTYSQAGNLQLTAGAQAHYFGAGANGFLLDKDRLGAGNAAFYQYRRGLSERFTGDFIVQSVDGRSQSVAGTAANFGVAGSWAAYVGRDDNGAQARQLLGDGQRGAWFWRASWLDYDDAYLSEQTVANHNIRAEAGRSFGPNLRLSLIHADASVTNGEKINYTLPAVSWNPRPNLHVSARPEYNGDYAYDAQWAPRPGTRLSATRYGNLSQAGLEQNIGLNSRLSVMAQHDSVRGDRISAIFNRYQPGVAGLAWSAGVLHGEGRSGFLADASLELRPGLSARLQALRDPLAPANGTVVGLSLVADFAVTGAGLARGGANLGQVRDGGISGAIGQGGRRRDGLDLSNVPVLVDGLVRARTDAEGRYYVANLPPGVHRVELDSEGLPIELSVHEAPRRVEVRAGSLTRVDFSLDLRLGLAGQLTGAGGAALADLEIQLVDAGQSIQGRSRSNRYGYYRIDGVAPGRYLLRAVGADGHVVAKREIVLEDRFLFGQELNTAAQGPTP
ncbi:carboxypeptidase-like regulatory domain-containing protein [Tahibacter harae]|uniref:Carboxypeptidase-like regulatory domain-containing protein n=1 Tax=Tahibacter harae TaxID=2963937 RepID=A0ABT1QRJ9_9GAMM|nr:carboxypeptidase-like regulatory domain-containing protein [Tahibacter harae]MCQ4164877.1 carboxypeptidase-like regulatory domain-containing protein [Tahibacter harae]